MVGGLCSSSTTNGEKHFLQAYFFVHRPFMLDETGEEYKLLLDL